jgi:hypothetical protein
MSTKDPELAKLWADTIITPELEVVIKNLWIKTPNSIKLV